MTGHQNSSGPLSRLLFRWAWGDEAEFILADLSESVENRRRAGEPAWRTRLWLTSQLLRSAAHGLRSGGRKGSQGPGGRSRLHPALAFRLALRGLGRDIPTSLAVMGILALGITAPAVFFSLLWGGGMRPLPVPAGDRIVRIEIVHPRSGGPLRPTIGDLDLLEATAALEGIGGFDSRNITLRAEGWGTVRLFGAALTPNTLDLLRIRPAVGRVPGPGENGVLLGWDVWHEMFDGDPSLLGANAYLDGIPATIAGVMPEGFGFPLSHSAWIFHAPEERETPLSLFGRLAAGYDKEAAGVELTARWQRGDATREAEVGGGVAIVKGYTEDRGESGEAFLFLGLVVVGIALLIIAAVNAANLLLVRAVERLDVLAVQAALGAGRAQMALQLFAEALLLSFAGGAIGLALIHLVVDQIQRSANSNFGYYWMRMEVELPVALFTLLLVLGTGVLAGFLPVRRVLRTDLHSVLKRGAAGVAAREGWFGRLLTSGQLALSCAALAAAGLASEAIGSAGDFGRDLPAEEVALTAIEFPAVLFGSEEERVRIRGELIRKLEGEPGLGRVAVGQASPGFREPSSPMELPGLSLPESTRHFTLTNAVTPGWFDLYDIELVRGRLLTSADAAETARVAVVNGAWVERWAGGKDPIGLRVGLGSTDGAEEFRIVGVVGTLPMGLWAAGADARVYTPLAQAPAGPVQIQIRNPGDPLRRIPELRRIVAEIHPDLAITSVMTLRQGHEFMTRAQRVLSTLAAGGGYAALLVAAVGLYALLAFKVRRRRRELGVRLAMGADGRRLGVAVLREAGRQVAPAMIVGLGMAWLAAPALSAILLENDARAPSTFGAVAVLFLGVTLLSALRPALTASRVRPADVLREE